MVTTRTRPFVSNDEMACVYTYRRGGGERAQSYAGNRAGAGAGERAHLELLYYEFIFLGGDMPNQNARLAQDHGAGRHALSLQQTVDGAAAR